MVGQLAAEFSSNDLDVSKAQSAGQAVQFFKGRDAYVKHVQSGNGVERGVQCYKMFKFNFDGTAFSAVLSNLVC